MQSVVVFSRFFFPSRLLDETGVDSISFFPTVKKINKFKKKVTVSIKVCLQPSAVEVFSFTVPAWTVWFPLEAACVVLVYIPLSFKERGRIYI